ncbi:MAG: metal-sensitive transcriptional regulator [Vulcanimicrobiaceae bacterium]
MTLPPNEKADVLARLRSVRGHIDGVLRMIEDDAYCVDVVKQVSALRAALDKIGRIELRNHFRTCMRQAVLDGREDGAIDELMGALAFTRDLL